jgi:hypothetical protein
LLLWSWRSHGEYAQRYAQAQHDPGYQHLRFIRVPGRVAGADLVAGLASQRAATAGGMAAE